MSEQLHGRILEMIKTPVSKHSRNRWMAHKMFQHAHLVMKCCSHQCNRCAEFLERYQLSAVNIPCLIDQSLNVKSRLAHNYYSSKLTHIATSSNLRALFNLEELTVREIECHVSYRSRTIFLPWPGTDQSRPNHNW